MASKKLMICVDFDTFHQNPKIEKRFEFDGKIFEHLIGDAYSK